MEFTEWMETALEMEASCKPGEWVAVCGTEDTLAIRTGDVQRHERPFDRNLYGYQKYLETISCTDCDGPAGKYPENRCCVCDSVRRFNLSDIEWVQELCIQYMDRDTVVNVPVSMIDRVTWVSGGWDIHCSNGWNYRLSGNNLYDEGRDAGPNASPLPRAGMTI